VSAVLEAIGAQRPDAECVVHRDRRLTWSGLTERSRRLAHHLAAAGLGCHTERAQLAAHESGQDHLAVYLLNGCEYLETMLGAFKARVAPFNVNYRYVAGELRQLLTDARPAAIVVHSRFAPTLAEVLPHLPPVTVLLQVNDESGHGLLPGATWFEEALGAADPSRSPVAWSPDDLYILYTGGTTGLPRGVLWRNGDALVECFGGPEHADTVDDYVAEATTPVKALLPAPFMHGAGQWVAMRTLLGGGTVHIPQHPARLDPADVWRVVERERIDYLMIVGDAFARPLLDELDRRTYDLSSLTVLVSGGATLADRHKRELFERLPTVIVVDGLGSSEAGGQLAHVSTTRRSSTGVYPPRAGSHVLSADFTRRLGPGDTELGWLAKTGRLALGYLGDPKRTANAFPVVDGVRYAVAGDRAHFFADGSIGVHGRDSAMVISGGEKIFAEEVESALKEHVAVADCVVAGRPSERWGQEVVAIVQLRPGSPPPDGQLRAELRAAAARHIARYKLPKAIVFVDRVVRSPSGKADYRWARSVAATST
jgi:fatty-acyl-CoA synthase